jgi:sulfur-oxidizing protein SoxY
MNDIGSLTRRRVMLTTLQAGAAALLSGFLAREAAATPDSAAQLLKTLAKGEPKAGKVNITAPSIAENGNAVPLTIGVDSKMTDTDHVKAIHVVADGNPNPGVASFKFTPTSGKAEVQIRVRMAQTQNVIAVAELQDGSLWSAAKEVKVTIGGCGG